MCGSIVVYLHLSSKSKVRRMQVKLRGAIKNYVNLLLIYNGLKERIKFYCGGQGRRYSNHHKLFMH